MENAILIDSLYKSYPNFFLNNISMVVPKGSVFGIIGENGAGKTTLINLILNQKKREKGEIYILGMDNILNEIKIKNKIGFVIDECCFHSCFTSEDVNKIMKSIYEDWDEILFHSYIKNFHIERNKKISEYSKGMKSKMMLSVALSHNPSLLILDEITSGLDPVVRDDILQILKDFVSDGQKSVLFSTHITSDLEKIADNVAFLHKGKLVFSESRTELLNKYLIVETNNNKLEKINDNDIIGQVQRNNVTITMIDNFAETRQKYGANIRKVTIDDLMLIYIKGGYRKW